MIILLAVLARSSLRSSLRRSFFLRTWIVLSKSASWGRKRRRCLAATGEKISPGNCLRVAGIKLKGGQYYSLTALISVLRPEIQKMYNHATRGCQKLLQTTKPDAYHYEPGTYTTIKKFYQGRKFPIVLPIEVL